MLDAASPGVNTSSAEGGGGGGCGDGGKRQKKGDNKKGDSCWRRGATQFLRRWQLRAEFGGGAPGVVVEVQSDRGAVLCGDDRWVETQRGKWRRRWWGRRWWGRRWRGCAKSRNAFIQYQTSPRNVQPALDSCLCLCLDRSHTLVCATSDAGSSPPFTTTSREIYSSVPSLPPFLPPHLSLTPSSDIISISVALP